MTYHVLDKGRPICSLWITCGTPEGFLLPTNHSWYSLIRILMSSPGAWLKYLCLGTKIQESPLPSHAVVAMHNRLCDCKHSCDAGCVRRGCHGSSNATLMGMAAVNPLSLLPRSLTEGASQPQPLSNGTPDWLHLMIKVPRPLEQPWWAKKHHLSRVGFGGACYHFRAKHKCSRRFQSLPRSPP